MNKKRLIWLPIFVMIIFTNCSFFSDFATNIEVPILFSDNMVLQRNKPMPVWGTADAGGKLKGFAIAGSDKKFRWANAEIDGETVVVHSDKIPNPVSVRYAWAINPIGNLYNKAGLPASPFRTDSWQGITFGRK